MPTKNIKLKVSKELKNDKSDKTTITKNGNNMSGMEGYILHINLYKTWFRYWIRLEMVHKKYQKYICCINSYLL